MPESFGVLSALMRVVGLSFFWLLWVHFVVFVLRSPMQTDVKGLLSQLDRTLVHTRQMFQNWLRQEIVDDDPYDVETLFPETKGRDSDASVQFRTVSRPR